jgi:hypothetical protein
MHVWQLINQSMCRLIRLPGKECKTDQFATPTPPPLPPPPVHPLHRVPEHEDDLGVRGQGCNPAGHVGQAGVDWARIKTHPLQPRKNQ